MLQTERRKLVALFFRATIADLFADRPEDPITFLIDKLRGMPDTGPPEPPKPKAGPAAAGAVGGAALHFSTGFGCVVDEPDGADAAAAGEAGSTAGGAAAARPKDPPPQVSGELAARFGCIVHAANVEYPPP